MARKFIPDVASPFYPPRARWYSVFSRFGNAIVPRLALERLGLPRAMKNFETDGRLFPSGPGRLAAWAEAMGKGGPGRQCRLAADFHRLAGISGGEPGVRPADFTSCHGVCLLLQSADGARTFAVAAGVYDPGVAGDGIGFISAHPTCDSNSLADAIAEWQPSDYCRGPRSASRVEAR